MICRAKHTNGSELKARIGRVLVACGVLVLTTSSVVAQAGAVTPTPALPAVASDGSQPLPDTPTDVVLIIGAPGNSQFAGTFAGAAADWRRAAELAQANLAVIGPTQAHTGLGELSATPVTALPAAGAAHDDLALLETTLEGLPARSSSPLWIAMVGHGTFDGKAAKFNMRGPDLTPEHLVTLLERFGERTVVIVNGAPASSPFLSAVAGPNRIIITATNNPVQNSATRFGPFFAAAVADPAADLDKDNQVSLLEAFLVTSRRVAEFYETEGRLATEQPLLDDNADTLGTRVEFFRGIRPVRQPDSAAELDGYRAHQVVLVPSPAERTLPPEKRTKRDELEMQVVQLRDSADQLPEDQYLAQLNALFTELALIYEEAEPDSDDPAAIESASP